MLDVLTNTLFFHTTMSKTLHSVWIEEESNSVHVGKVDQSSFKNYTIYMLYAKRVGEIQNIVPGSIFRVEDI